MSIVLHAIAFVLWALVVFFTIVLGAVAVETPKRINAVIGGGAVVIALFVLAFTLQVIA